MVRRMGFLLALALLLATAAAALAGGWAVIALDAPLGDVHAGQPWAVNFTVLQHGRTPVHKLDANSPVEPLFVATNPATGERLEVAATPLEEVGRYTLEVTFPSDGAWEWAIEPRPLIGETAFAPLDVLPAIAQSAAQPALSPAAPASESGLSALVALSWAAAGVAAAAVALALFRARRRAPAGVRPES